MLKNRSFIIVVLAVFALSTLLFLTPLDSKFFDLFLRILPSLTENQKVFVLTLDDESMDRAGGFPFRREVMADVVVLLKELGVDTIAFDLSYLDESAARFDPAYAMEAYDWLIDNGFDMYDAEAVVQFLGRDVDEYFAQAIAFSDNSWLTLTFLSPEDDLTGDGEIGLKNEDTDSYLAENHSLDYVTVKKDTKTRQMATVIPSIHKLRSRSSGAGFVNASVDRDGLRRRIDLLLKYNDDYYGQLTLLAMQKKMGWSSIEVSNRAVTLKMDDGGNIRIPRAQDGSMLLKWPKKNFYDYNYLSLVALIQYTIIEPVLAENLALMDFNGFFSVWDGEATPWEYYQAAKEIKEEAFFYNEPACEEWLFLRQSFFDSLGLFLNGPYEKKLIDEVSFDEDLVNFVYEIFEVSREQYDRLAAIRENEKVKGLQDSFCVIGSDATSMTDIGIITFQKFYPNVGTYAVVANMLLSGEFLDDSPWYLSAIIALIFSLLMGFFISRFDTYKSIITGVAGLFLLTGGFLLFFYITKIYIGFSVPLISTLVTFVFIMINKFLTTSKEKAFIHNAFSRYLAPEVITQIINDPDKLNLGGEKREMTAVFTDIRGFSSISEKLDPVHLVQLLNRYLTGMSNIVMENQGTIDKYIGDAIVAFWGAPLHNENHAVLACRSALAMKAAERELNKTVVQEGLSPVPIFTRIGVNTGDMVVGNMGAENKMDYTIMGNAVNLTARLEGVNNQYKTGGILISEYTREKIGDEFLLRRLDRVRVVGINTPLRLYELLALKSDFGAESEEQKAVTMWEQAIDLYEQKRFREAFLTFKALVEKDPDDGVAKLYAERCKNYVDNPPSAEWDAINNLTEK